VIGVAQICGQDCTFCDEGVCGVISVHVRSAYYFSCSEAPGQTVYERRYSPHSHDIRENTNRQIVGRIYFGLQVGCGFELE
jgi:hypothetical protein